MFNYVALPFVDLTGVTVDIGELVVKIRATDGDSTINYGSTDGGLVNIVPMSVDASGYVNVNVIALPLALGTVKIDNEATNDAEVEFTDITGGYVNGGTFICNPYEKMTITIKNTTAGADTTSIRLRGKALAGQAYDWPIPGVPEPLSVLSATGDNYIISTASLFHSIQIQFMTNTAPNPVKIKTATIKSKI